MDGKEFIDRMRKEASDPLEALAAMATSVLTSQITHDFLSAHRTIFLAAFVASDKLRAAPVDKLSAVLKLSIEYHAENLEELMNFMLKEAESTVKRLEADLDRV